MPFRLINEYTRDTNSQQGQLKDDRVRDTFQLTGNYRLRLTVGMLLLAAVVGWLAGCAGPGGEKIVMLPRKTHYDIALPYPKHIPPYVADSTAPRTGLLKFVPVYFDVDESGHVAGVAPVHLSDSALESAYYEWLMNIRFEPGTVANVKTGLCLPGVLTTIGAGAIPGLQLPVLRNRGIHDADLYWLAMEANGIELPSIKTFPSYYTVIEDTTQHDLGQFDVVIARLGLDASGKPTSIDVISSTSPGDAMPIRSAILWGEYTPLLVKGVAQPCTTYVVVSMIEGIDYPTCRLPVSADDSLFWIHSQRVRMVPDTVGYAVFPLPRRPLSGTVENAAADELRDDCYVIPLQVDTLGAYRMLAYFPDHATGRKGKTFRVSLNRVLGRMRLYPALDFRGHPAMFAGPMMLQRPDSGIVRITYPWYTPPLFESIH